MEHLPKFLHKKTSVNYNGQLIDLSRPLVMGILNITPDSFYAGSRYKTEKDIVARVAQIIDEGGAMIDVGAYSSRPQADDILLQEEVNRLRFALSIIKKYFPQAILSVDTFRSAVVETLFHEFGGFIVNDIAAGGLDGNMFATVGKLGLPYIAMHMKGSPQTMMSQTHYNNLMADIISYFVNKIEHLKDAGVVDIILDPGFGFSKNLQQNYELLNHLNNLAIFELPLLVGVSRKGMIYKLLSSSADEALNGTTVANTIALYKGADILRVHDVKQAAETIKIVEQTQAL